MTRPLLAADGVIRGVLFDLDGTLLDTLEDIANAANRVLVGHGFPPHEIDAYRRFVGDGLHALVGRILPEAHRNEATIDACLVAFRADYGRTWNVATRPYPGVAELLDALVSRDMKRAVLSNKPDDLTHQCVRELLPHWPFDVVMGERDGIPRKPDPTAALQISELLGLVPSTLLFVGDSPVDMVAARAAGMPPVGALWGFRSRGELLEAGARTLLHHPTDLIGLLDRS